MKAFLVVLPLALIIALAGCSKGGPAAPDKPEPGVPSITLEIPVPGFTWIEGTYYSIQWSWSLVRQRTLGYDMVVVTCPSLYMKVYKCSDSILGGRCDFRPGRYMTDVGNNACTVTVTGLTADGTKVSASVAGTIVPPS